MKCLFSIFTVFLIFSCSSRDNEIESILSKSGTNRKEVENTLSFYQKASIENDTARLKLTAVKFLLRNMGEKKYLSGKSIDEFHRFIDSVYQIKQKVYDVTSIYEQFTMQAKYQYQQAAFLEHWDVNNLTCDFIIKHVETAFELWNKPWAKHLNFDEFCEFLLPYRIADEEPELWKNLYHDKFSYLLPDSICSVRELCNIINKALTTDYSPQITIQSLNKSAIRPSSLINIKFGDCIDYARLTVYVMRSLGIPAGLAVIPHWGKRSSGHSFNILKDENGNLVDFSGGFDLLGEALKKFKGHAKIYHLTFGEQKTSLASIHGEEAIPEFFQNPCMIDITGKFPMIGVKDVALKLPEEIAKNHFAYLCVFDTKAWHPVAWGKISKRKAVFKDIGTNVVYQLATYNHSGINPTGNPFLLDSIGNIHYFFPETKKIDLILERKQDISQSLLVYPSLLVGGKFQGSNTFDFHDAEDLYVMDIPDFKYTTVSVSPSKPYKFYRYLFSDTAQANMAEVAFYEKNSGKKLSGEIISEYTPSIYYPEYGPEKMFDGDALTFFNTIEKTPGWGGIHLNKPVYIDKIRYIIRNDDNGIRKKEVYELLYMQDGKWISMGEKPADKDDEIAFENVPQGALYWLKNHTKGKEERIFSYENGKQIFW
jgi:hypothetical protein